MGEHQIRAQTDDESRRTFARSLLDDVRALERLLAEDRAFETDVRRIGAEQELVLVDAQGLPARISLSVLERLGDHPFTTELGLFNLEANLPPLTLGGDCLARLERELTRFVELADAAAAEDGASALLCGILPTLSREHLGLDSMTPIPRYHSLNRTMCELRGGRFRTLIKGLDELQTTHDNVMLEACNTSFQVHFQVAPSEFARRYNLAQVVTAPVLAAAVNSPVLLQQRLWHETRIALLQQSLDVRTETQTERRGRQRVSFGDDWVEESVLEIFKQDISRYRILIAMEAEESALEVLDRGEVPALRALCLHNGTVYRWNRPCYGVQDGRAHLRIENRVLPAGPTVLDQVAGAAFYFGLLCGLDEEYGDVRRAFAFDDVRTNFVAAARYGLDARMHWRGGRACDVDTLILEHLLPLARGGLAQVGVDASDSDRYLGVLEDRVRSGRTGARWALDSLAGMGSRGRPEERHRALSTAMLRLQRTGRPAHEWELATLDEGAESVACRLVGQVMTTDLFTVHPEDLVDLAASLMDWEHIRHVPVEDQEGELVGLLTSRALLRILVAAPRRDGATVAVRDIMKPAPTTVEPSTTLLEAIDLMRRQGVGCLPVVQERRLVGIVTERDLIDVSARLLDRWLRQES